MASKIYEICTMVFYLLFAVLEFRAAWKTLDSTTNSVLQYGAIGDGITDDSQAFLKAWSDVCGGRNGDTALSVPIERTFLLTPIEFQGPCNASTITLQIDGKIVPSWDISEWVRNNAKGGFLEFSNVKGLIVQGNGIIDGRGDLWWPRATQILRRPRTLGFIECDDLVLTGLTYANSPSNHIYVGKCNNVTISHLQIYAPKSSPNTDGIDVRRCTNVWISNCTIATGDDCIAIAGGSSYINISDVSCGPGHGISLGANGRLDTVEQVHVQHCGFIKSTNGVRIKTWQGGSGYAKDMTFEDITLDKVSNPIIIDQYYCFTQPDCSNQTSAVKVSNITYRDIRGTSGTVEALKLRCSETIGCSDLLFDQVNITFYRPRRNTRSSCTNAHGRSYLSFPSIDCLLP